MIDLDYCQTWWEIAEEYELLSISMELRETNIVVDYDAVLMDYENMLAMDSPYEYAASSEENYVC